MEKLRLKVVLKLGLSTMVSVVFVLQNDAASHLKSPKYIFIVACSQSLCRMPMGYNLIRYIAVKVKQFNFCADSEISEKYYNFPFYHSQSIRIVNSQISLAKKSFLKIQPYPNNLNYTSIAFQEKIKQSLDFYNSDNHFLSVLFTFRNGKPDPTLTTGYSASCNHRMGCSLAKIPNSRLRAISAIPQPSKSAPIIPARLYELAPPYHLKTSNTSLSSPITTTPPAATIDRPIEACHQT